MGQDADFAHDAAGEVLSRMIIDGGPSWVVLEVVRHEEVISPPTDPNGVSHLRISLGEEPGGAETVAVYFTTGVPRQDAVVATASQIQDHAIEAAHGSALPLCPGHRHPLHAGARHGVAYWTCPKDPSHHNEPILRSVGR
jgi:hypothetical protein